MKKDENTTEQKIERIEKILKKHNIRIKIGGCGCCGSPWVSFEYKGEIILSNEDGCNMDMFAENK